MDPNGSNELRGGSHSPRKRFVALSFLALCTLAFAALGVWQVERLFWKLDLIARVDARVNATPITPPVEAEWTKLDTADFEYRHITATGTLLNDRETLVQAVTELGAGFWVLTPLRLADGSIVLINRGFVPPDRKEPASRMEGQPAGVVTMTGLMRVSEPGGAFLRSNDAKGNRWYSRDVEAIAAARGLEKTAPYFIDADKTPNPGGYPVGGLTVVQFRNSHLQYAATWFILAAMSLGALIYVRRKA